jgi:hypothetical protein
MLYSYLVSSCIAVVCSTKIIVYCTVEMRDPDKTISFVAPQAVFSPI